MSVVVTSQINKINAWFIVDKSGSMSGTRWTKACQGVIRCLNQLAPTDFFGVLTFNDKVEVCAAGLRQNVDLRSFEATKPGGATALYDAINTGVLSAIKVHQQLDRMTNMNLITHIIVLTDGEDTGSKTTLSETIQLFRLYNTVPNIRITLAGIELDANARASMQLLNVGDKDIELIYVNRTADLDNLFEHITTKIFAAFQVSGTHPPKENGSFDSSSSSCQIM